MHHRSTGWRHTIRPLGCAVAALLCLPGATAVAKTVPVAGATLQASGLEAPAGGITDPNGRTWISDHVGGFCRLTTGTPGALEADTCLGGGLTLTPAPGPAAAGQPSVARGGEVVFVPDEAAGTNTVSVLQWNAALGLFSETSKITMLGVGFRPTATSLGPDGNLYVAFKKSPAGDIQRVRDPLSDSPVVEVVGHTDGSPAVAAGYDAAGAMTVYAISAVGIDQLHPDAATQPTATASPFTVAPATPLLPTELGALYYDLPAHMLYAGSANALHVTTGVDFVDGFNTDTGVAQRGLLTGLTTVSGLSVDAAGSLLVGDVPAADAGISELYIARDTVAPAAPVISGMTQGAAVDGSPALGFTSPGDPSVRFECSLDGGAFTACAAGHPFTFGADGSHTLLVRAVDRAGNASTASAPMQFTVKRPVAAAAPAVAPLPLVKTGSAVAQRLALVGMSARISGPHGVRYSVQLAPGTRVVRLRLYRAGRLVTSVVRSTSGARVYRGTLRLRRALRAGRYRFVVTPGRSSTALGKPSALTLRLRG